nr:diguanylate cyclase [Desulfobulbaceae bacterium]
MTEQKKTIDIGSIFTSPLFRRFLTPIILTMLGFALAVYFFAVPVIKNIVYSLEEKSVRTNLNNIHELLVSNYSSTEAYKKSVITAYRRELKNIILFTETYLKNRYDQAQNGVVPEDQAQWSALEELRNFRYGNNDYLWVADYNGFYLSHPDPKMHMEDISEVRDVFGNYILTPLIQLAVENGEGYHSFWSQRLDNDLPAEKLSYARVFPEWEWVIGSEIFIDELETEILVRKEKMIDELRQIIKGITIARTGYLYIFDSWNNVIIHPDLQLENSDMSEYINPLTKNKIADDLIAASKTKDHKLEFHNQASLGDTEESQDMINWVQHVEGFDWYIVASVKTSELSASSDALRNKILILASIVVVLSILMVSVMMGRLLLPIRKLSVLAGQVEEGDLSAQSDIIGNDEISFLAKSFNSMVSRLRANIEELDQKVMARTEELHLTNKDLTSTVGKLEQHNWEVTQLNRLAEKLQACNSLDETFLVVSDSLAGIFHQASGALYMADEAGQEFDSVIAWGGCQVSPQNFKKGDCKSFQEYRIIMSENLNDETLCAHISPLEQYHLSLCLPLFGQNEVLGLIYLVFDTVDHCIVGKERDDMLQNWQRLAISVTDHLSMAMANLRLRERLQNLSVRDGLTGLFNRRYMEETLAREFQIAERDNKPVGVIILDVDFFKKFNDTYGHEAGDVVLVELGKKLTESVRGSDVVCRYGGEEFVVVLPGPPSKRAIERAELIRHGVEHDLRIKYNEHVFNLTISLGVASYPADGSTPEEVLKAADNALYRAKDQGRNQAVAAS